MPAEAVDKLHLDVNATRYRPLAMTTPFRSLHAAFPPDTDRMPYDGSKHDAFAVKVPEAVAAEWREFGFGGYGHGILWMTPPDEPFLDPEDWDGLDGTGIEVLRSAFADVCLWQGGRFHWVSVLSGKIHLFSSNPEIVFDALTEKDFRKSALLERLFGIARKRLGDLGSEECYGFAPLPALGGAIAEQNLIKTPMREDVAIAAQTLR
jgi:hypothetical protein